MSHKINCRLTRYRGTLALIHPILQTILSTKVPFKATENITGRDDTAQRHITVFTPLEVKAIKNIQELLEMPFETSVYFLGLGMSNGVYFQVVAIPQLQALRAQQGLAWCEFHVTLSFESVNLFDICKGPRSLPCLEIAGDLAIECLKEHWKILGNVPEMIDPLVSFTKDLTAIAMPSAKPRIKCELLLLSSSMNFRTRDYLSSLAAAKEALEHDQSSINACIRVADASFKLADFETALQMYWKSHLKGEERVKEYTRKMLKKLWSKGHIGMNAIPWSSIIDSGDECEKLYTESRDRTLVDGVQMRWFFSWLIPGIVAGMSTPKSKEDILLLEKLGFTSVITLTEEEPLPCEWFENTRVVNHFWPVTNYYPPTITHADKFLFILVEAFYNKGGGVLVHCKGGKGRAGSLLATYLVRFGLSVLPKPCDSCTFNPCLWCPEFACCYGSYPKMQANDAIRLLREIRPGSIESDRQEQFIASYSSEIYNRASGNCRICQEEDCPAGVLKCEGDSSNRRPMLILMMGLPASGKSWFASKLASKYNVISQDEIRSREACERLVRPGNLTIIDMVNALVENRKKWKQLAMADTTAIVYFDASEKQCQQRAQWRFAHPTLPPHRAHGVIQSFAKQMQPPTLSEADSIYRVSSFNDAIVLLAHFGVRVVENVNIMKPQFFKYPRTRHLFNVGGASRDDLVISPTDATAFLATSKTLTIEEKIDGANIGFRLVNGQVVAQNRAHDEITASTHPQFEALKGWIYRHNDALKCILSNDVILFGEWMAARHSIEYDKLADLFIAFDIYELKTGKFVSRNRFHSLLENSSGISTVPAIEKPENLCLSVLKALMEQTSAFSSHSRREGLVLRIDDDGFLVDKAKIVREDFIAGNKHWSRNNITPNRIR